jgi:hypothetical protein
MIYKVFKLNLITHFRATSQNLKHLTVSRASTLHLNSPHLHPSSFPQIPSKFPSPSPTSPFPPRPYTPYTHSPSPPPHSNSSSTPPYPPPSPSNSAHTSPSPKHESPTPHSVHRVRSVLSIINIVKMCSGCGSILPHGTPSSRSCVRTRVSEVLRSVSSHCSGEGEGVVEVQREAECRRWVEARERRRRYVSLEGSIG